LKASFPDLRGEHRTEATPPAPYRLVADVDVASETKVSQLRDTEARLGASQHHEKPLRRLLDRPGRWETA